MDCLAAHHMLRTCQRALGCTTCLSSRCCVCGCSVWNAAARGPLLLYASSSSSSIDVRDAASAGCRLGRACRACLGLHSSGRLWAAARVRAPAPVAAGPLLRIRIVWTLPQRPACAQPVSVCLTSHDAARTQGKPFSCSCQAMSLATCTCLAVMLWCSGAIVASAGAAAGQSGGFAGLLVQTGEGFIC